LYSISSNGNDFSEKELYYAEEGWNYEENVFIDYGKVINDEGLFILKK